MTQLICPHCNQSVDRLCIVSVFIPGRNEAGIQNTVEIGQVCADCIVLMLEHKITLPKPDNALTFTQAIGEL
jgi:hypothetical protein